MHVFTLAGGCCHLKLEKGQPLLYGAGIIDGCDWRCSDHGLLVAERRSRCQDSALCGAGISANVHTTPKGDHRCHFK